MTPPQRNPEDRPVGALLAPDILTLLEESPADIPVETEEIHPADLADVAELLEREQLQRFLTALGPARAADVLEYLDEELRTEFIEAITPTGRTPSRKSARSTPKRSSPRFRPPSGRRRRSSSRTSRTPPAV